MRLAEKVVFISGGARGMGEVEARLFAKEGAKVAIGDVLEEDGRRVEGEINEAGGEALFLRLDVTSEPDWQRSIAATVSRFGRLDILVNNAGITPAFAALDESTLSDWSHVMDINAAGVFLGMRAAIPELRRAGGGSIVNISSILGLVGQDNVHPAYIASKGAVRLLTKSAAVQYAAEGIRVNSVHPGVIDTDMIAAARADPSWVEQTLARTPMGRFGQSEEVAYGVLYLASDEASYVTGTELVIDGGWTAQ